jgi:alkylhydroperoxidase/carboxymuconolactone decarboxylase family protein YurZ/predicted DNA-binding transcriptional regulator AlpA
MAKLHEWDPDWADKYLQVVANPWTNGVLSVRDIELFCIGITAACTNLDEAGVRRHIRRALEAGATRAEILTILKGASMLAIHSCSLGAPILLEEAKAAGAKLANRGKNRRALAARWGVSTRSIARLEASGAGPRAFRVGRLVRWTLDEVRRFEARAAAKRRSYPCP